MGQKVNPFGLRLGINKDWESQWYANKQDFAGNLYEDYRIRTFLKKKYYKCSISKIVITRAQDCVTVNIYTAKVGMMIGPKGANVEVIKAEVKKLSAAKIVNINIREIKFIDRDAQLVAEYIASRLEARIQFRRAMKDAMGKAMKAGAKGIKTNCSGRLEGAEIARHEHFHEGSIPLQTLRANIDYGFAEAHTTFGLIGVKVWIYQGEILGKKREGGNA